MTKNKGTGGKAYHILPIQSQRGLYPATEEIIETLRSLSEEKILEFSIFLDNQSGQHQRTFISSSIVLELFYQEEVVQESNLLVIGWYLCLFLNACESIERSEVENPNPQEKSNG